MGKGGTCDTGDTYNKLWVHKRGVHESMIKTNGTVEMLLVPKTICNGPANCRFLAPELSGAVCSLRSLRVPRQTSRCTIINGRNWQETWELIRRCKTLCLPWAE